MVPASLLTMMVKTEHCRLPLFLWTSCPDRTHKLWCAIDGSSYYDIHHNVMYASGGLKSDYAGHDKLYHHNLNIGGGNCGMYNYYQAGHQVETV